jgi:protein tyrosine phosphatase (PTP) superfamily phosphohydrolase (DUF442 family)
MKNKTLLPAIIAVAAVAAMFLPSILWPKARPAALPVGDRSQWAKPITKPGLPNLHQVSSVLYRGARPTREGVAELARMGVKTIIDFQTSLDRPSAEDDVSGTGIQLVHIGFHAWHPEDDDVVRFLRAATDESKQPLFVHCRHGSDRTGMMCAIYRIVVEGWTKDQAISEMTDGGFGFHPIWQNLPSYIRTLDVEKLRAQCGRG